VGFVRSWMLCGVCMVMDVMWGLYAMGVMWGLYGEGCYVGFVR
jgi:hypothetical protein